MKDMLGTTRYCIGLTMLLFSYSAVAHCVERQEIRRSFDVRPGATISLENVSGDITITSGGGSQVEMVAVKTGPADQLDLVDLSIDAQPSRLSIKITYSKRENIKVSVNVNLKVPRDVNLDRIKSVSGDVNVTDIDGRVVCRSVSGDVKVQGAGQEADLDSVSGDVTVHEVSGRASAHTVSGDVEAFSIQGDVDTKSVSGDVQLRQINGYITAESVSGGISIDNSDVSGVKASSVSGDIDFSGSLNPGGRYAMKSHSGTVKVALPPGSGFDLQASTYSGSIKTDFDVKVQGSVEKRSLNGIAGPGGATLELSSFSGDVVIKQGLK